MTGSFSAAVSSVRHPSTFRKQHLACVLLLASLGAAKAQAPATPRAHGAAVEGALARDFETPPPSARLRCYWWWLNGHTTEQTITRDLTEMKAKGYGGVLLVDANGADQGGNGNVPAGPEFGSPAWTKLYLHALDVASRLGLEVTLNITSGWNLGGPWVKPEQASKLLTWSRSIVAPGSQNVALPEQPPTMNSFYRQIAVLAYPLHQGVALPGSRDSNRKALRDLAEKSAAREMGFSMPDATSLLKDPDTTVDADASLNEIVDITATVSADGHTSWTPPAGSRDSWEILRVGYTSSDARVSTASGDWQGLAIDYLDTDALDLYWKTSVLPLILAAGPHAGKTLKYVASDSWELGGTNWTSKFREEFRQRRGYDPVPYLPIVAGRIVGSRDLSTRFLNDLRRTVADLIDTHYDHLATLSAKFGMGIQCESGGPHGAPMDALQTFRHSAVPQTEFWAMSREHRSGDTDRFFVKEASSAAHIYGQPLVADEGETSIGNQWNESLGMNLKPSFDQALTEGMNRLVWHQFTSSPAELGLPGQEYFAGTHLNPNVTWWRDAGAFTVYLNRSQFLLQQGQPVSDVLYYYGDNVPNFVRLKRDDPAKVLPGFDYDVSSTDALLTRMRIVDGVIQTPEGIRYRALALPKSHILPLAALELAARYVEAGGLLIGMRPLRSQGIVGPEMQQRFSKLADRLWTPCEAAPSHHAAVGKGQLFCVDSAHDALQSSGILPDFEATSASLDYVHRRTATTDIYFIRNTQPTPLQTAVTLRIDGKQPEFFHADTGEMEDTLLFTATSDHRTRIPLTLTPYGSIFIVLRHAAAKKNVVELTRDGNILYNSTHSELPLALTLTPDGLDTPTPGVYRVTYSDGASQQLTARPVASVSITTPWTITFPPNWGAPPEITETKLDSWTNSPDPGVRYFSGTATYRTTLHLDSAEFSPTYSLWLSLGAVDEVAAVRINGKPAQVLWKQPWTLRAGQLLHPGDNVIEIDVTNLWPNRLIGDAQSADGKHYTWTNIRKYTKNSPLLPSGLLGPVTLEPLYRLTPRP